MNHLLLVIIVCLLVALANGCTTNPPGWSVCDGPCPARVATP